MTSPDKLKTQLRRELRARRRALDPARQQSAARAVARALPALPGWDRVARIALYLPADGEVDTRDIVHLCRATGRTLYLPRVGNRGELHFALWQEGVPLHSNRYGIPEPPAAAPRGNTASLDLVLLPLVGWDRRGNRLGMGGGYYDRALAGSRPGLLVGLAHGVQEVEHLPAQAWDVRLDYVLSEQALHRCGI